MRKVSVCSEGCGAGVVRTGAKMTAAADMGTQVYQWKCKPGTMTPKLLPGSCRT